MKIGIFGGSFDPIHSGHALIVNYLSREKLFDEIWIMVNRRNPLKFLSALASNDDRLAMAQLVAERFENVKVSDFEMNLPSPSFSIETLRALDVAYPEHEFSLIIGSDNWANFGNWKSSKEIISDYGVTIYPRPGFLEVFNSGSSLETLSGNVRLLSDFPLIEISSTEIRGIISKEGNVNFLVPDTVKDYILQHNLYR